MKYVLFVTLLSCFNPCALGESVLTAREQDLGYENLSPIEESVQKFNSKNILKVPLTDKEVVDALIFELGNTNPNNNAQHRKLLLEIIESRKLPKGSLIKNYRKSGNSIAIFLLFNLNLQPLDKVPEPGSVNQIKMLPIRVNFSASPK